MFPWYIGYECLARLLLDWSSGHAKYKENALNAKSMSLRWGGETNTIVRSTKILKTRGSLGPYSGQAKTEHALEKNRRTVNYKLEVGDVHHCDFQNRELPPFYDMTATPGNGDVRPVSKAPKGAKEFLQAVRATGEHNAAVATLARVSNDVSKLKVGDLKAIVRARTQPDESKRIANAPKLNKKALVAEASRLNQRQISSFFSLHTADTDHASLLAQVCSTRTRPS